MKYRVVVQGIVTEVYQVEADSDAEAYDNWYDGDLMNSPEGSDYEVVEVLEW
jgi:hypothetical protein